MAKSIRELSERISRVDAAVELVDARIPVSGRNPALDDLLKSKPRVIVLTKTDLAERASTAFVAPAARLISTAREFIEQNAVRGITPNDIAHHLGISRRLLDLRFGELTDVSVARMIRETKLKALKAELLKSSERISVIGRRCGFANANYLKRIFLADTGLTMAEWRSRNGKKPRGQQA